MERRLIDAVALKEAFNADVTNTMQSWDTCLFQLLMLEIDEAPSIEAEPKWISVKERLPDRGVEVLGTNGKEVEMCTYWPGQPTPWESWTQFHFKPTHWMSLPEPPKEDGHG